MGRELSRCPLVPEQGAEQLGRRAREDSLRGLAPRDEERSRLSQGGETSAGRRRDPPARAPGPLAFIEDQEPFDPRARPWTPRSPASSHRPPGLPLPAEARTGGARMLPLARRVSSRHRDTRTGRALLPALSERWRRPRTRPPRRPPRGRRRGRGSAAAGFRGLPRDRSRGSARARRPLPEPAQLPRSRGTIERPEVLAHEERLEQRFDRRGSCRLPPGGLAREFLNRRAAWAAREGGHSERRGRTEGGHDGSPAEGAVALSFLMRPSIPTR